MPRNDILHSQKQTRPIGQDQSSPSGRRAAREILLLCTTANISPGRKERISQILSGAVDWRYLLKLAEFHGVAPLISHNLTNNGLTSQVPKPHLERLNQVYSNTLYRNVILSNELSKVFAIFSQHGVSAISLKGTILAEQLYENPALRTVVDMDILTKPEELSLTGFLLLEMGYQKFTQRQVWDHPFHEVYCKQMQFPVFIELHWNLDDERLVAIPQREIWHRAQLLKTQDGTIMVLSPEDTLLFLSNSLFKQSTNLLRYLSDIVELLKKHGGALNWDYIIESAHSWGIGTSVYYSLSHGQDLLGAVVPVSVIKALRPSIWRRWVLGFLMSQDTFVSPINWSKLRSKTSDFVHSLMMKHMGQMLAVLSMSRHHGRGKKVIFLTNAIWFILIFGAALGRNIGSILFGRRWRAT